MQSRESKGEEGRREEGGNMLQSLLYVVRKNISLYKNPQMMENPVQERPMNLKPNFRPTST